MENLEKENQLIRGLKNNLAGMFKQVHGRKYDDMDNIIIDVKEFYALVEEVAKNELWHEKNGNNKLI
ncbi:MAG: hypothetical protein GY793_01750 [Proteobacteria bacterium]|nr:hypothetical protein [Pseudomonadota bacterium]